MSPVAPGRAIANARKAKVFEPPGFCLRFVRLQYGVDARDEDATMAWEKAEFKHPVALGAQVPRGAPVLWTGGKKGHGHIAIGTGNGNCWSSDAGGPGKVAKVNIDELTKRWNIDFMGWTEDINGVRVFEAAQAEPMRLGIAGGGPKQRSVRLDQLRPVDLPDVRELQRALKRRMPAKTKGLQVDGCFGPRTKEAYAAWQRRCGFRGAAADGIPGTTSLQRLGFKVLGD